VPVGVLSPLERTGIDIDIDLAPQPTPSPTPTPSFPIPTATATPPPAPPVVDVSELGAIAGRVLGMPADVEVCLGSTAIGPLIECPLIECVIADDLGRFVFEGLPTGVYTVLIDGVANLAVNVTSPFVSLVEVIHDPAPEPLPNG